MRFGYPRTLIIIWALFYLYHKLVFWIYWKLYNFLDLIISQKQWLLVSLSLECLESNAHNRYCSTPATSIHELLSPEYVMFFCTSSRHIRVLWQRNLVLLDDALIRFRRSTPSDIFIRRYVNQTLCLFHHSTNIWR